MEPKKAADNECIQVVVRCRPLNSKEKNESRESIIDIDSGVRQVSIRNPENPQDTKYFTFDATYDANTQQRFFYDESCFGVIEGTLEGFNSTIFAYGQTGCGKSFTMQGPDTTADDLRGVIPNSFGHIFQFVKASKDIEFLIRCSYLELYNEEIRDLLSPNQKGNNAKCELKEDPNKGVYVKGLTDVVVESADDLSKMLDKGLTARTTASTNMNSESSRSHSIFTIVVEMSTKDEATGKEMLRSGKLNLVDLAGSERQKKTGAGGATLKEGIKINMSLSALGNVISALSEGGRHIPYRDSKLTRLLQDSLGGNTKTMMIAAISPADYNFEETMSTLRYANRAKNIKNKPKINEDPKDAMIREFKEEIERLRQLLAQQSGAQAFQTIAKAAVATNGGLGIMSNKENSSPRNGKNSNSSNSNSNDNAGALDVNFPMDGFANGEDAGGSNSNNNHNSGQAPMGEMPSVASGSESVVSPRIDAQQQHQLEDYGGYSPDKDHAMGLSGPLPAGGGTGAGAGTGAGDSGLAGMNLSEEQERLMRQEVENRLAQLQHMVCK